MIGSLIGLGLGAIGTVGKMIQRGKNNRDMEKLLSQDPSYKENPLAAQRLGLAQTLLNSRMPGAAALERNIYTNQASRINDVNRGATDASQALALGAGAQGQTNQAFGQLQQQEAQNFQQNLSNLTGAQEGMINEGDKVYNDQIRRFGDLSQVRGAQAANRANNWGDIANTGFGIADFGMQGGFNNMFPKKQGQGYGLPPMQFNGTYGSGVPMTGGLMNRTTPNFG
jgi:hypothetical protein